MNSVEIAIQMETDAISFYIDASERVKNKVGRRGRSRRQTSAFNVGLRSDTGIKRCGTNYL